MKYTALIVLMGTMAVFLLHGNLSYAEDLQQSSLREEHNKSVVLRYINEVIDGKQFSSHE